MLSLSSARNASRSDLKSITSLERLFTKNVKAGDLKDRQRDSFAPKKSKDTGRGLKQKEQPVLRRPGLLIEQSWMSGKDV